MAVELILIIKICKKVVQRIIIIKGGNVFSQLLWVVVSSCLISQLLPKIMHLTIDLNWISLDSNRVTLSGTTPKRYLISLRLLGVPIISFPMTIVPGTRRIWNQNSVTMVSIVLGIQTFIAIDQATMGLEHQKLKVSSLWPGIQEAR